MHGRRYFFLSLFFSKNEVRFLKLKFIHLENPQNFSSKSSSNYIPVFHLETEGNQTSGTQLESSLLVTWSERNFTTTESCSMQAVSVSHVMTNWIWVNMRRLETCFPLAVSNSKGRCKAFWYQTSQHWSYCLHWTLNQHNTNNELIPLSVSMWRTPTLTQIRLDTPPRCWAWCVLFLCTSELYCSGGSHGSSVAVNYIRHPAAVYHKYVSIRRRM